MNFYRVGALPAAESSSVEGFFHGRARLEGLATTGAVGMRVNRVAFGIGARTVWHSHAAGQLLVIVEGEGEVASRDGVNQVGAGDVVWTAPDEEHWHGASEASTLVHIAVSLGETRWERA